MAKDKRYSDPDEAPEIVSEKRLTFFLTTERYSQIKTLAARCIIENDGKGPLPETPSAVIRLAVSALFGEASPAEVRKVKALIGGE